MLLLLQPDFCNGVEKVSGHSCSYLNKNNVQILLSKTKAITLTHCLLTLAQITSFLSELFLSGV